MSYWSRPGPWLACVAVILAATGSRGGAQQTPTPSRPNIVLVPLTVRVLDKAGQPVPGLTPADFAIEIDGTPAPIRALDYISFASDRPADPGARAPTSPRRAGRSIIYGIDDLTMRPDEVRAFTQSIARMAAALSADDVAGLVTTSATGNVAPSRDRAALVRAVRMVAGRASSPALPAAADLLLSQQLDAIFDMVEAARGLPEPRVVVLCSNGLALGADRLADVEALAEMAARAGVQIEFLTQGATATAASTSRFAERLGAPVHRITTTADQVLDEILLGWAATYRLTVEPAAVFRRSQLASVKVVVRRDDVVVRAAPAVVLPAMPGAPADPRTVEPVVAPPPAGPPPTLEEVLRHAAEASAASAGVVVVMASVGRRDDAGASTRIVSAEVPKDVRGPLRAHFAIVDAAGVVLRSSVPVFTAAPGDDYRTVFAVPAVPGAAMLRIAVADASGALGVAEEAVGTQRASARDELISDIMVTWIDEDGSSKVTALDTIPVTASAVQVMVESYQAPGATTFAIPAVSVLLTRVADDQPLEEWTPQARMARSSVQAAVALPWATLPPGVYRVTIEITTPGAPPVTKARTLSKR